MKIFLNIISVLLILDATFILITFSMFKPEDYYLFWYLIGTSKAVVEFCLGIWTWKVLEKSKTEVKRKNK